MPTVTRTLMGDPPPGRTEWAAPESGAVRPTISRSTRVVMAPISNVAVDAGSESTTLTAEIIDADQALADQLRANPVIASPPLETLRPVAAIEIKAELKPIATAEPMVEWMAPADLLIDGAYQRDLSAKSLALIEQIAAGWDWRRFKPPVIAFTERGFEIIDGQHTAIGAATRGIARIPVLVVEAAEREDRASAFIGHNSDRVPVSKIQLHHAAVAAGETMAVNVERVCQGAGVTIIRTVFGGYQWKAGDTVAIKAVADLISRRGDKRSRELLQVLVKAGCAPVTADGIKAVERLLTEAEYADDIEAADLVTAIKANADSIERDAKAWASEQGLPRWRGIAAVWFKKCRKRRRA